MEAIDYYPFGSVRVDDKATGYENDYKYTGKELDTDTGLYYYGARYYNSDIGRFTSEDPAVKRIDKELLFKPQELNFYSYVANNPLRYIDPTGEKTEVVIKHPINNSVSMPWSKDYGHAMININGTFYDYSPKEGEKLFGGVAQIQKQEMGDKMWYYNHDGGAYFTAFELNITSEQEARIQEHLDYWSSHQEDLPTYNAFFNNCVEYINEELLNKFAGFNISNMVDEPTELSKELYNQYKDKNNNKIKNVYGGYEKDFNFNNVDLDTSSKKHSNIINQIKSERDKAYEKK